MKAWERNLFDICLCWPVNNLFLLIRSHQHPRLVSLVVNISLLTSQTRFFQLSFRCCSVLRWQWIVSIRSISPRLGYMLLSLYLTNCNSSGLKSIVLGHTQRLVTRGYLVLTCTNSFPRYSCQNSVSNTWNLPGIKKRIENGVEPDENVLKVSKPMDCYAAATPAKV